MKDNIGKQFRSDQQLSVVVNESEFPELIHEENDLRRSGAHDLGELFVANGRNLNDPELGAAALAREFQKGTSQPQLAMVEKLIAEIFFHVDIAG